MRLMNSVQDAQMCPALDPKRPYCSITVKGPLRDSWADYLGDLSCHVAVENGHITTTLDGQPADLLAFVGMLSTLANWGFAVVTMEYRQTTSGEATPKLGPSPGYG